MKLHTKIVVPLVLAAGALTACTPAASSSNVGNGAPSATQSASSSASQPAKAAGKTVEYTIEGTGTAGNVSYNTDGAGSMAQESDVALPWTKTMTLNGSFLIGTLSAQADGSGKALTCRITVDGKVVKESTSNGAYAVVSCSGSL